MANAKEYKRWEASLKKVRAKPKPKKQVLGRVLQRLFKPSTYPMPLMFGMPFLVAVLVALFSQYVVVLPVKSGSAMPGLILAGLIIGVPLAYKFRAKRIRGITLGAFVVIGFFLVPYFAFMLGKMHLFAVDQPPLPGSFTVIEMRVKLDNVVLVTADGREVLAQGPTEFTLYPGATRIHVGTLDIPAGSYVSRKVSLGNVDVDVEADLATWPYEVPTPSGNLTIAEAVAGGHITWEQGYENYKEFQDNNFKQVFPNGSNSNWSALDGTKFTFTMSTGAFQPPEEPQLIDYPGTGGPDVTLDFTLSQGALGWQVAVTPILDFPPGMGPPAGTTGGPPS